jgi:serine/threonine protein kinase/tetratricopeptide (TPR) repeat protein
MTAERWQQIEAIMQSALDIESSAERMRFVSDACAGDEDLRRSVERLMIAAEDVDSFIESPAWTSSNLLDSVAQKEIHNALNEQIENGGGLFNGTDDFIGKRIGVFELVKELGRGGMGTVYLAERADGEFRQKTAVKLIKRGMETDFIVRRFRHERQILAALNHPNIARLIDGGTSTEGLPYFVMEYVEGIPLYRFCDERKLSTTERLRLFKRLCEAVEAAHELKVIHRDLKPSNILVKADGTPKLLDFGIAKILDPDLPTATLEPTATAMRLMTPEYASPEQVYGEPVSPASDIYSLGVLLYELLTGHRPYRFKNRALHEIHRAVCEEMPSVPSESLTGEDNFVPTGSKDENSESADEKPTQVNTPFEIILRARNTNFEKLRRELAGDLDKIVLKTLRKNPADRYQTVSELADDITRFLEKRPVTAESFVVSKKAYVVQSKTSESDPVGRQSAAILPFKIFGATNTKDTDGEEFLGIGLADALVTRLSVIRQIVMRPTSSVLAFAETTDPFRAGRELSVDFVVDGNIRRVGERIRVTVQLLSVGGNATLWAQTFDEKFTDVLELEDSISERIAKSLLPHLSAEEKRQIKKRGTDNPEAFEAYLRGRHYWNAFTEEGFAKSMVFYDKAIAAAPDYALAYSGIADYYNFLGVYAIFPFAETSAAAKTAARKAIEIDPDLAEAYAAFGFATLMHDFDWMATERNFMKSVELNPNYAIGRVWYGYFLGFCGRFNEALSHVERAIEIDRFTPIVPQTLNWILYHARRFDEAIAATRNFIKDEPRYGLTLLFFGSMLWRVGQFEEAIRVCRRSVELLGKTPYTLVWLASAYAAAGESEETRQLIAEIDELSLRRYVSPYLSAMIYANLNDREKALTLLEKAWEIRDGRLHWLGIDPQFDRLRDDARLNDLLRRMNHPLAR